LEGWVLKTQLSQEMEETATPFSSSDVTSRWPRAGVNDW